MGPEQQGGHEGTGRSGWARARVVLYVLLGLAVVEVLVGRYREVWWAHDPNPYRDKVRRARQGAYDVVLAGGSPVCEGLDPRVVAGTRWRGRELARAYNLGLSGATTAEVWHSIKYGVSSPPRLLVYGITATDLNDSRGEPQGPRALMSAGDVAEFTRLCPGQRAWGVRQHLYGRLERAWGLYHHRNGMRLWAAGQCERRAPGSFPEAAGEARELAAMGEALGREDGHAPSPEYQRDTLRALKARGPLPVSSKFLEKYRLGGYLRYLDRILDWGREREVDVVLLDMPVSRELEGMYPEAYRAYALALAGVEKARGVRVLRGGREAVGLTEEDFADLIHLNARGMERLSRWLRYQLEEVGPAAAGAVVEAGRGEGRP